MIDQLFSYDPSTIAPKYREQMAEIITARLTYLKASVEVNELRARSWGGEAGLTEIIELKSADLAKLRMDFVEKLMPFLQEVVNLDALKGLLPMVALGVLNTFKVPLPVIGEAIGLDVDNIKMMGESIKELIEEVKNS